MKRNSHLPFPTLKKALLLCLILWHYSDANAVKVVFRLDDPNLTSLGETNSRAIKLFIDKEVPLSIALIPCDKNGCPYELKDSTMVSLFENPLIEFAQHGLTHADFGEAGEFGILSQAETEQRISAGHQILTSNTGQDIVTFVPPYNGINTFLPQALLDNGMYILSDHLFNHIYAKNIQYYPETLGHLIEQKGIWAATEECIFSCKEKEAVCVVMFHAYDLPDDAAFVRLADILDRCQDAKSVELYTFRSLYESGATSNWFRYKANQYESLLQKHLLQKGVLHTAALCIAVHTANALIYACIQMIFMLLSLKVLSNKKLKLATCTFYSVAIICMFIMAWRHLMGPMRLLVVDIIIGCLPLLVSVVLTHKTK